MCSLRVDEVAFRLVSNPWFDGLIIATIVINCIFLGLYDPTLESNHQEMYLIVADFIFCGIFSLELLIEWLALGISTYFKNKWKWVDFIVVVESIVSVVLYMLKSSNVMDVSVLRGLRVLRALRAVTYIQQVKLLFETIISASRVVIILLICIGCVIIVFGNVGYTYWAHAFGNTCVNAATTEILDEGLVCGRGYSCPDGYVCAREDGFALNYGVTGYQDIWHAMLQAFQVISLDGWQQVMWHTQDAAGEGVWIYFVMLLILGNVLLVSMFPAVISSKLEATIEKEEDRRRKRMLAETSNGDKVNVKRGTPASELELLLIKYAKLEADEIATFERLAAVRRGDIVEQAEKEPPPPPWTPFPRNHRLNRLRKAVLEELGPFAAIVYSAIFINAFVLCLDHAGASENEELVLSGLHKAFTVFFMVEMTIKLGLLGPAAYFTDAYNLFDFTITCLGLIEIAVDVGEFFTGFRVTRIFRIARVVRVMTLSKLGKGKIDPSPQIDLARMIGILMTSIPWIINIYAVQVLLMYTFTVLGMQFFGGALPDAEPSNNSIRFNYNSFGKAGVTLLDLVGNRWSEVMMDTVGATGRQTGIIFYVLWFILSHWLVVAMVGTVFFYRVDVDTEEYIKIAAKTSMHSVFALERAFIQCNKSHVFLTWRKRYEEATGNRSSQKRRVKLLEYSPPETPPGPWQRILSSRKSLLLFEPDNRVRRFCQWLTSFEEELATGKSIQSRNRGSLGRGSADALTGVTGDGDPSALSGTTDRRPPLRRLRSVWERNGDDNSLRPRYRFLHEVAILHRIARFLFEGVMVYATVVIMVVSAFDAEVASGRRPSADETPMMRVIETCAVVALCIEAVMMILAHGLVLHHGAYLRRPVYVLTFGLVVVSAACLWGPLGATRWDYSAVISGVRALRALIVIRLVKFIYRSEGILRVLRAVTSSWRGLCLAGGMALLLWIQWSIVGLQVWKGALGYCSDQDMARLNGEEDYYVYRTERNGAAVTIEGQKECVESGFEWKNARWNFDSFPQAMQSVLITFSFNGWQEILFSTINARVSEEGLNAVPWHNTWAALYFLVVLLTSVVLVLLVVGVVFSMYVFLNLTKGSDQRLSSLKQAFWLMYEAKLVNVRPDTVTVCPQDAHALRRWLFKVAVDPRWGVFLVTLIGTNVVVRFLVGSQWLQYRDAPTWIHVQEAIFAVAFVLEWVSRAIAFGGIRALTRSPFQLADFITTLVLALVFVAEIIFLAGSGSSSSQFWVAMKAISMVRLVRLGHVLPEIKEILHVFFKSSEVVFPLLVILVVLTYLWSVCGVILFGNGTYLTALFDDRFAWEAVNRHQGFYSVAQGMQTMLGVATTPGSDGWLVLMERYKDVTPKEWRWGVVMFFSSYAILTRFLLANFFMMTLLFSYKMHSNKKVGIATEQVRQFKLAWMRHTFIHTKEYQTICAGQLVGLLRDLPPPLGVGHKGSYYDCQILAKKVLCAMGVHAVAHVPAEHLTHVLSLRKGTRRGSTAVSGHGFLRLDFSKVLVAVHRILLFGVTQEDERHMKDTRARARSNLSVLKLGVHLFLDMPHNHARREIATRDPLESVVVAENSVLRTQLPATFMARSSVSLLGEFLRWQDCLELRGYTDVTHKQGICLANAIEHEIVTTTAFEELTARLLELHGEDRRLFSRLAEVRQHASTLRELQGRLHTVRGDYVRTTWDASSLVVRQTIQVESKFGIATVCASKDGAWLFCATCGGQLKVFKRERRSSARNRKSQQRHQGDLHPQYALVQTLSLSGIKDEREGGVTTTGLSVACSPDGYTVVAGCSDSKVRVFAQDTLGLRRAVRAMKLVEGNRGKKPTMSYRAVFVGKGHKAAVKCAAWMEPGYFYTGGAEGMVCMWRRSSAKQPAQSIDVCRSMFSRGAVECLTVWRTTYGLDLLASCIDIDDTKEVDPPVYIIVGDSEGYMSVLPARTDRKFFSIDVWRPSLRHQVDRRAGTVTAVEVAWGRVYTACGPSGLIKAWTPRWKDATKEKLLGFEQVGQFAVHSGAVSSIVFTNKELMFTCSDDLSIVTWHPPRHPDSFKTCAPLPRQQSIAHPSPSRSKSVSAHRTGRYPEQGKAHELESAATCGPAMTAAEEGAFDGDTDVPPAPVIHEKGPGFVVHEAGVAGMVLVPGAVVSVDIAGRLLVRGPKTLPECHFLQVLPQGDDIRRLSPSALRVLKAKGHTRRSDAAIAAVTGALGRRKTAVEGHTTPEDNKGPTVFLPQTTLDHLFAMHALLRAKAKRRQTDEMRMEKQRAKELSTTGIFGHSLGQHQGPHGRQEESKSPKGFAGPTMTSAAETYRKTRRCSLLQSVSGNAEQMLQNRADADKVAEMDEAPVFLESSDLDRLAEHPEVYLAELMGHFFPSRDLAGRPPAGQSEGNSSSLFSQNVHEGQDKNVFPGASVVGAISNLNPLKRFGGNLQLKLRPGQRGIGEAGVTNRVSREAVRFRDGDARVGVNRGGNLKSKARAAASDSIIREEKRETRTPTGCGGVVDQRDCVGRPNSDFGALVPKSEDVLIADHATLTASEENITLAKNTVKPLKPAWREEGKASQSHMSEDSPPALRVSELKIDQAASKTGRGNAERRSVPGASAPRTIGIEAFPAEVTAGMEQEEGTPRGGRSFEGGRSVTRAEANFGDDALFVTKGDDAAPVGRDPLENEAKTNSSFPWDDISAAQQRRRDFLIVYVPLSPAPGVWAAGVDFYSSRDVAWVLAEALRMYEREHLPLGYHRGLARKPRLVQRPSRGLFSRGKEWTLAPALPPTSPIRSLFRPGEELVVLVEGFDPGAAFGEEARISGSTPLPDKDLAPNGLQKNEDRPFSSRKDGEIREAVKTSGSVENVSIDDDDTLTDEEEGITGVPRCSLELHPTQPNASTKR